ncbi:hypothetical protein [Cytobacillus oceanisediminis]|uniref:hypothetical protein n=1 Tax=Cytobacillus oceanisediminis TaxID=665099 RepID=UPI001C2261FB|nr:hypothetical protein [Cytobacillus oceanisediminis]MBU8772418.1 hypothetical protein [Cytobacillus oceanisediminis]
MGKPKERVRTWSNFGQTEPGATSDRRVGKPKERVRTWSNFGQKSGTTERESPNLEQLKTGEWENRKRESEPGATSDRRVGKPRERARTWCNFGQEKRKTGR